MGAATRYAVVDDATQLVSNVCLWDGETEWVLPAGQTAIELLPDEFCEIGFLYGGGGA